ncbi:MAG: hypothetical protein H7178_09235 [Chitinophagaceae bacterium]|nr:hypothetical protein [Chitinophagaceae bacterium]
MPIDHGASFNSNTLERGLVSITPEETLIHKPLMNRLGKRSLLKDELYLLGLEEEFYFRVNGCKNEISKIITQVPLDWKIDKAHISAQLESTLFSDSWNKTTFETFLSFIQIATNH